jgi:adenylate cyclase
MFQKAVDTDPDFLRAWVQLAEQGSIYALFFSKDEKWRKLADRAATKASELAPGQAESYLAQGYAHATSERFVDSERALRKAIELDPAFGRAWHHLARAEQHQGKSQQAIASYEKATEFDPDDYESPLLATNLHFAADDMAGARRTAKVGVERAARILQDYPDNQRAYYLGSGGHFVLGNMEKALQWTERALALNPDDPATRYNSACFFAKFEETHKRALDLLQDSVISRSWIENDPDLDPIRKYPRFKEIVDALPE